MPILNKFLCSLGIYFCSVLCIGTMHVYGQMVSLGQNVQGARKERVEAMRAAYISRYVNLTSEEARNFWPVYNEYQNEIDKNRKDFFLDALEARIGWESKSDAEVEKALDQIIDRTVQEGEIKKKYHEKFKKILPIRKVALLYMAERQFIKELVRIVGNNNAPGLRRNAPGGN